MSAADVTPERIARLRKQVQVGGRTNAWRMSDYIDLLDALESAWRERDALRAEVERLRDELTARDAAVVRERVSWLSLAGIGRKHFGNPIPQAWYDAARELLSDALRSAPPANNQKESP